MQIFMEYKVHDDYVVDYERLMPHIKEAMKQFEVWNYRTYKAFDQPNLFVEMFEVTNQQEYEYVKTSRRNENDPVFGKLAPLMTKPLANMNCWAFIEQKENN
ncbi:hypothetical protein [Geomicrobium sp. JCM 19038]|uniref:hypothetical protein n=1 Tax=Geomicrobium sp. JCM 19038 TaxID=1460635 RepID=UPI00045F3C34|nr:hypothetical protein [Geomicrobium sp. JCM 19038]GAK10321.1 hypothetical protein JCM19038_4225 [Geomicrobium sp. JCM 19038]